ncbi:MAG: peptide ABC transporter substrate-binding protein [Thermomicrobium sp.]|nr:peptide ABC transporter substrate-binding protein [Thermomicrobium sp.]
MLWLVTSVIVVAASGALAALHFGRPNERVGSVPSSRGAETVAVETAVASPTVSAKVAGGTFRLGIVGRIETLDPLLARSTAEAAVSQLLFEGLVRVDGSGQPQPALATTWETSDDGLVYTLHLRTDVDWHDGQPFTARDVLFTIRLVQDPSFPGDESIAAFWRSVQVEVVDADTVRFRLTEPYAPFLTHLMLPILPEHALAGTYPPDLPSHPFSHAPIGTGPYRVEKFDTRNGVLELVRVPGFDRPTPVFDRVVVKTFDDVEEALASFRAREVDSLELVPWVAALDKRLVGDHARVYAPIMAGYTALFLNNQAQFFADVRVRQAVSLAIDRERLVRDALAGQGEPGNGPIPPGSWAFQAQEYRYDPDAARQLLRDAGWEDRNGDGVLDQQGLSFRFTLLVNADDAIRVAVAQAVAEQLAVVGIAVTVQPVPAETLQRQLLNREYTAAIFGWMSSTGDPDAFELWHSSQADVGTNVTGFRNRTVDILLEEARRSTDMAQRRSLYVEFQRLFAENVPAVVLYYPRYCFVVSDRIGGVEATPLVKPEDHLRDLPRWYRIEG